MFEKKHFSSIVIKKLQRLRLNLQETILSHELTISVCSRMGMQKCHVIECFINDPLELFTIRSFRLFSDDPKASSGEYPYTLLTGKTTRRI